MNTEPQPGDKIVGFGAPLIVKAVISQLGPTMPFFRVSIEGSEQTCVVGPEGRPNTWTRAPGA